AVGAVLSGDGLRARAARVLYPGDELRAGAMARLPAVARLRRHHRSHGQHVLRQPHRGLGDRRRLPARLSAAHGRGGGGVEIAETALTPGASLTRSLRLRDLIFIVVGTVIGSGIFVVPGAVLRQTGGDVGSSWLVWVLGGVLSLLGALTYGELGGMLPEAGGAYVYVREAFGPLPAFLLGWTLFFVISTGSVATLAVAFAEYLRQFVALGPTAAKLVAALRMAVVGAVNVRGTRHSANVQNWSTGIKVAAILGMSVLLLGSGSGLAGVRAATFAAPLGGSLLSGIGVAMIGVLWAYEGWANVAASAGETLEPQHSPPRGCYAMASDGGFFRKLAEVHPRFGTPAFSVLVSSAWAIVLAATGSFEQLFTYVIFAAWVFYTLAGASVFVLRRRRPAAPRP